MDERCCENCRYAATYDGLETLGCLADGAIVYPSDTCEKHRYRSGHKGGRPRKTDKDSI